MIASATLTMLFVAGMGPFDAPLLSGPPVGARNNKSGFYPQFIAGPGAGEHRCPV